MKSAARPHVALLLADDPRLREPIVQNGKLIEQTRRGHQILKSFEFPGTITGIEHTLGRPQMSPSKSLGTHFSVIYSKQFRY